MKKAISGFGIETILFVVNLAGAYAVVELLDVMKVNRGSGESRLRDRWGIFRGSRYIAGMSIVSEGVVDGSYISDRSRREESG